MLGIAGTAEDWLKQRKASKLQRFEGQRGVGLVGLGGGMALTVSDWLASEHQALSAAIDMDSSLSGGTASKTLAAVLDEFQSDESTDVILVNMIASGNRIDRIASDLLPVLQDKRAMTARKPIVVHLQGNGGAEATALVEQAGFRNCSGLREAMSETLAHLKRPA